MPVVGGEIIGHVGSDAEARGTGLVHTYPDPSSVMVRIGADVFGERVFIRNAPADGLPCFIPADL